MTLDECLRREVTVLLSAMNAAAPRLADRRPWWIRLALAFSGVAL